MPFVENVLKKKPLQKWWSLFEAIKTSNGDRPRPKVAIFGDLYARDNEVMNQHLIHFIEEQGGEVITTPYSSYVKMITGPYFRKWFFEGRLLEVLSSGGLITLIKRLEDRYLQYFNRILPHAEPAYDEPSQRILSKYHMRIEHTGESMDNILKIFYLLRHYPDLSLFVQTSPAFCCPSLVTEAMANRIEAETGVPHRVHHLRWNGRQQKQCNHPLFDLSPSPSPQSAMTCARLCRNSLVCLVCLSAWLLLPHTLCS